MKILNQFGLPAALVNAIVQSEKDYTGPRNSIEKISCTTLIGPPRIHFLRVRHYGELVEDAADRIFSLMGTLMHSLMEKADDTNVLVEERQEKEIDGITVSGQADRITNDGSFEDYKFTTLYSVKGGRIKDDWILQLNVLNWIFYSIFKAKKMVIHAILRDWSKGQYKRNPTDIPPVQYKRVEITDIWPIEKAEAYVKERVALFKSCAGLDDSALPLCTDTDTWAKPSVYAVMREGRKSAIALCDTEAEAKTKCGAGCNIVHRPGERIRCEDYCNVKNFCSQYAAYNGAA
jgi:hypothetical protein